MSYREFSYEEIKEKVNETIEVTKKVPRRCETQRAMDRLAEVAYAEEEIHIASAVLALMSLRMLNLQHLANQALLQLVIDHANEARAKLMKEKANEN
jgi:hypothetical protein